jgi:hypothetical protein
MISTIEGLEGEDVKMVDEESVLIHSVALILDNANRIRDDC